MQKRRPILSVLASAILVACSSPSSPPPLPHDACNNERHLISIGRAIEDAIGAHESIKGVLTKIRATNAFPIPGTDHQKTCMVNIAAHSARHASVRYAIQYTLNETPDGTVQAAPDPISLRALLDTIRTEQ